MKFMFVCLLWSGLTLEDSSSRRGEGGGSSGIRGDIHAERASGSSSSTGGRFRLANGHRSS